MNIKKNIAGAFTALAVVSMASSPVMAKNSVAFCQQKAKTIANQRALGSTAVGAIGGCIVGAIIGGKCGTGAAVGGVGGFAIGSIQWKKVYNKVYKDCRNG